jgi:Holliday junction resolvasome RuvABC endonuclease subunit
MIDIGVDIGIRRLAIGVPMYNHAYHCDLEKPGVWERDQELRTMTQWLREIVNLYLYVPAKDIHLWVEQPFLSNGGKSNQTTTIAMAETVGAVQAAMLWGSVNIVSQSTWKAQVCGNGRLDKLQVGDWLAMHHPGLSDICSGQDEVDAMCIGLYGIGRSSGEILAPVAKPKKKRKLKEAT